VIAEAINFEMSRNGQVYIVTNRVASLQSLANLVHKYVPDARIATGHGQMPPDQLEKVIMGFVNYDYDVLISTTIVENGIDVPNANTIIIDAAHHFGLSDLHQMRGRVGRGSRKAFCYLIAPPLATLATGTTPYNHGVVGLKWLDRETLRPVFCVDDKRYPGVQTSDASSPTFLGVSTLGDELKVATEGKSLVYAIAPYRDAAILSAGHAADGALWIDDRTGQWCSTRHIIVRSRFILCCVLFGSPKPTIARQSYEFIADWLKGGSKNSVFRVLLF
jgi:hypothetical protein